MSRFRNDVRTAWRVVVRGRATTIFAVLAFALGIGVTTAVFSLFYGVLLKPLPYPNPDELVVVYDTQPACKTCPASFEKYIDWKTRNQVFQAIGGSWNPLVVVTGLGEPERVQAARATATLLDVFGVRPERDAGSPRRTTSRRPEGRRAVRRLLAPAVQCRPERHRPHDDDRRRSVRSDRRSCRAEFQHRRAELFLPVQRAFNAGQSRQSLSRDVRAPEAGRYAGSRAAGDGRARRDARRRVRSQPRHRRPAVLPRRRRQRRAAAARADGRGGVRPADRVRERREPAARVGSGAPARARRAHGARRHARGSGAPTRARERRALARRWR